VGLDASFIGVRFIDVVRRSPFYASSLTVPILDLHRRDTATVRYDIIDDLPDAARYTVELDDLNHVDFNSYVLLYSDLLGPAATPTDAARRAHAYVTMVLAIERFLEASIGAGGTTATSSALQSVLPRMPAGSYSLEVRRPR
jgi:hypothetical protein